MSNKYKDIPDFDDLLFEKRNKAYGAYQLRKKYKSVVIGGTIIASLLFSLAVILPFFIKPQKDQVLSGGSRYVTVRMENLEPPMEQVFIPPAPPPPAARRVQEIVKYVPPVVVDSIILNEKPMATIDEVLSQPSEEEIDFYGYGNGNGEGDNLSGDGFGDSDEPFVMVEIMPLFRGGDINKFREWVQKRTNYPQAAIDNKIQGRVMLTFIVEPDGSVSNVMVLKSVDPIIDDEAVKSIEASPKWSPGLQRGKPVRVRFSMWLSFVI